MKAKFLVIFYFFGTQLAVSQVSVNDLISQTQSRFAPDKRVAIFKVGVEEVEGKYYLHGKTNLPKAKNALLASLKKNSFEFVDKISVLPEAELGEKVLGLVTVSVCNIRSSPKDAAEMDTQAILGMELNVLEKDGLWYLVQTPDNYIGWVDHGAFQRLSKSELDQWKKAEKLIITSPFAFAFGDSTCVGETVSDLVFGNKLVIIDSTAFAYKVQFPDSRAGFIPKYSSKKLLEWQGNISPNPENVAKAAKRLMGIPYLWGGTSFKGVDCSGLTKMAYLQNGIILQRDASQQVNEGALVDDKKNWGNLQAGDLLFFGKEKDVNTKEKVSHVGIWLGKNLDFIHSSGRVKIGSFDPKDTNYDSYNLNRYLRAKRILKNK